MLAKTKTPTKEINNFSYNLPEMKKAVRSTSKRTPKFKDFNDFDKWVDSL